MRALPVLLVSCLAWAALAGGAAAQTPAPGPTPDPKDLCARMPSEPGETKKPSVQENELIGGGPVALCSIELVDDPKRKVALHLIGFPGSDACSALERARGKLRGGGRESPMVETRMTLPGADQAVGFRSRSGIGLETAAILACRGRDLVLGTVGVGSRAGIGGEMELLEQRVRRTLSARAPVQGSGLALLGSLTRDLPPAFFDRFEPDHPFIDEMLRATRSLPDERRRIAERLGLERREVSEVEELFETLPRLREYAAFSTMRFPDGRLAFPSLGRVLPIIRQLAINAESDPRADRALGAFGSLVMQMDARIAIESPPPVP